MFELEFYYSPNKGLVEQSGIWFKLGFKNPVQTISFDQVLDTKTGLNDQTS